MQSDVKKFVNGCDLCQRVKSINYSMTGAFGNVIVEEPNDTVAIDFFAPLPQSSGGVRYIFVLLDIFSKLVTLFAIKRETTEVAINKMRDYFRTNGKPRRVLCDNGTQFTSHKWGEFLAENDVRSVFISVRHPQSNPAERVMREIGRLFRTYCSDKHTRWSKYVKQIQEWINLSTSSLTGYSPHELHYGENPIDKVRKLLEFPEGIEDSHLAKIEMAKLRIRKACEVRSESQKSISKVNIEVGQLVLLKVPHQSNKDDGKISKFFYLYFGPYRINRIFGANACELVAMDPPHLVKGIYNRADLRLYHSNKIEEK